MISGWRGKSVCLHRSPSSDPNRCRQWKVGVSLVQQQWQAAIRGMKKCFQMFPFCHITLPRGENLAAELENCRNWVKCFWPPTQFFSCCFHVRVNRRDSSEERAERNNCVHGLISCSKVFADWAHTERPLAIFPACFHSLGNSLRQFPARNSADPGLSLNLSTPI